MEMCADVKGLKILATLNDWFYAPDGVQYRAVFGTVKYFGDNVIIGNAIMPKEKIDHIVITDEFNKGSAKSWSVRDGVGYVEYEHPCAIYDAE